MKLTARLTEKPWGQVHGLHMADLPDCTRRIGEVAFEHPELASMPVLIKYLYTSERLSIQVHPDDRQAREAGHACGKDEMWIVLDAQPGATIGLGLTRTAALDEVEAAIRDGSIVDLVDWRPVERGDVIYNRAGTIHAAGAGLVLLEVQQSIDLTYRLYDFGRPRELHLEKGLAVSRFEPHHDPRDCRLAEGESRILADGPYFGTAWCAGTLPPGLPHSPSHWQIVAVAGEVTLDGAALTAGEAAFAHDLGSLQMTPDSIVLVAWPVQEVLAQAA